MARPRNSDAPDLGKPCNLTAGAIERLSCPPGKQQAFLRDFKGERAAGACDAERFKGFRVRAEPEEPDHPANHRQC